MVYDFRESMGVPENKLGQSINWTWVDLESRHQILGTQDNQVSKQCEIVRFLIS